MQHGLQLALAVLPLSMREECERWQMKKTDHNDVCQRTEHKDERVRLRNVKTGEVGLTFSCTPSGETIQVELENGVLDSWPPEECEEL